MAEPRGPRAVVGDSAEAGNRREAFLGVAVLDERGCFMNDGLVESRATTTRLIDNVGRNSVAHEIRLPAFTPVGRGFQACSRVSRTMDHDERRHSPRLLRRDLELHIHLANHY